MKFFFIDLFFSFLSAGPIKRTLDLGADIVITGRCVDSAVTLAPLMHEVSPAPSKFLIANTSLIGFAKVNLKLYFAFNLLYRLE